jgi:hypothetical protein
MVFRKRTSSRRTSGTQFSHANRNPSSGFVVPPANQVHPLTLVSARIRRNVAKTQSLAKRPDVANAEGPRKNRWQPIGTKTCFRCKKQQGTRFSIDSKKQMSLGSRFHKMFCCTEFSLRFPALRRKHKAGKAPEANRLCGLRHDQTMSFGRFFRGDLRTSLRPTAKIPGCISVENACAATVFGHICQPFVGLRPHIDNF